VARYLQTGEPQAEPSLAQQKQILLDHYEAMLMHCGEEAGVRVARKHVSWYSRGLFGSAEFRSAVNRTPTAEAVRALIDAFYDPLIAAGATRVTDVRGTGGGDAELVAA
jgi:tRNA-dihydrouridine synthase